jgi:hypothetical protein
MNGMHMRSPAPDYAISVAAIAPTKKRGRPSTGCALSQADRDRRYRAKKRFIAAAQELATAGLDPAKILREHFP